MNQKKTAKPRPKPPRAVREFTAGGVVFRQVPDGVEILMIQDPKSRWTIPKGHVEEGEQLEQTALREVEEETGLKNLKIRDKLDKIHFFYRKDGKLIFMTTYIFLMEVTKGSDELVPEDWMHGIQWFAPGDALKLIEYRDTEKLFRVALSKIRQTKDQAARGIDTKSGNNSRPQPPRRGRQGARNLPRKGGQ